MLSFRLLICALHYISLDLLVNALMDKQDIAVLLNVHLFLSGEENTVLQLAGNLNSALPAAETWA
jgi:hypothetical protein